jgi:type IV secretion system protein VirB4
MSKNPRIDIWKILSKTKDELAGSSQLNFTRHYDDATILTSNQQMIRIFELTGRFHESVPMSEINSWTHSFNNMLIGIGSPKISIWSYTIREYNSDYPDGDFDQYTGNYDDSYKSNFKRRNTLINRHFMAVVVGESTASIEKRVSVLRKKPNKKNRADFKYQQQQSNELLKEITQYLLKNLASYDIRLMKKYTTEKGLFSQPAEFLARLYNGFWSKIPLTYKSISNSIALTRPIFGKEVVEVREAGGSKLGGFIGIKDYAEFSVAGLIKVLIELDYPLIVSQSYTYRARADALHSMGLQFARLEQLDDDAVSQREAIKDGMDDLASGRIEMGHHHLSVGVFSDLIETPSEADTQLRNVNRRLAGVVSALSDASINTVRETLVSEAAFWAQFPANHKMIPRASVISSTNFTGFVSYFNTVRGQLSGNHWGDAVTVFPTTSNTPYYFNFHRGDLGHTAVIGMSGSGKTVMVNHCLSQSRKYNSRLFLFDKDRGCELFIRSMSGDYLRLKSGMPTGFNPFQLEPTKENITFLKNFVRSLCMKIEPTYSSEDIASVSKAVDGLMDETIPQETRCLSLLIQFLPQGNESNQSLLLRLAPWHGDGQYAWAFDNKVDTLNLGGDVTGFDMTDWVDDAVIGAPMMAYMFYRIKQELDGRPVQIAISEAWKALDMPEFSSELEDWFLTIRKKNGMLILDTQSPSSIENSPVADVLIQQLATIILCANERPKKQQYIEYLGLTEKEFSDFRTISKGSHQYLIKQGSDSIIIELDLTGMDDEIAILSGRESTVNLLDKIRDDVGDSPSDWMPIFHEKRKFLR